MRISNVAAGYRDLAALTTPGETIETAGNQASKGLQPTGSPTTAAAVAMAGILSDYDVTDISPTEFSEMIQKLFEAGGLTDKQFEQLAAIRLDLDLEGVEPDESIDLLEFYVDKVEKLQRRLSDSDGPGAARQQLGPMLRRLDWLEKFALIQSSPDAIGLDAVV